MKTFQGPQAPAETLRKDSYMAHMNDEVLDLEQGITTLTVFVQQSLFKTQTCGFIFVEKALRVILFKGVMPTML